MNSFGPSSVDHGSVAPSYHIPKCRRHAGAVAPQVRFPEIIRVTWMAWPRKNEDASLE